MSLARKSTDQGVLLGRLLDISMSRVFKRHGAKGSKAIITLLDISFLFNVRHKTVSRSLWHLLLERH